MNREDFRMMVAEVDDKLLGLDKMTMNMLKGYLILAWIL